MPPKDAHALARSEDVSSYVALRKATGYEDQENRRSEMANLTVVITDNSDGTVTVSMPTSLSASSAADTKVTTDSLGVAHERDKAGCSKRFRC